MFTLKCKRGDVDFVYGGLHYGRAFDHVNMTMIPVHADDPPKNIVLPLTGPKAFDEIVILNAQGYQVEKLFAPKPANDAPLTPEETERLAQAAMGQPVGREAKRRAAAKARKAAAE